MANALKHKMVSAVADAADTSKVRPSNWNEEHVFAGGADGAFLVFKTSESDKAVWSTGFVGPYAVGGAVDTQAQFKLLGTFAERYGLNVASRLQPAANVPAALFYVAGTIDEAGSGTHPDFASILVDAPTITAGAGALTNASTMKVVGPPTAATNNYAVWLVSGAFRTGGLLEQDGMAAPAVSPSGRGRIYYDSTSNKFRVSQNAGAYQDLVVAAGAVTSVTGTANQITASPTTGDVVLSIPTTAQIRMAGLGIGTAAPATGLEVANAGNFVCLTTNSHIGKNNRLTATVILNVGNQGNATGDLALAGGSAHGIYAIPTMQMLAGNITTINGVVTGLNVEADGSARINTDARGLLANAPSKGANVTITNCVSLRLETPSAGGTLNRVVDSAAGGYLDTGGIWQDASSRDYKEILARMDTPASYAARLTELRALSPVRYRYRADHLIRPHRAPADLDDTTRDRVRAACDLDPDEPLTLAHLEAAGLVTDARWNEARGCYEAKQHGRWTAVATDVKPEQFGIIAEELPELIRARDGKTFNAVAGFAWLTEVAKAIVDRLDRAGIPA
jgi:hypothetical protein